MFFIPLIKYYFFAILVLGQSPTIQERKTMQTTDTILLVRPYLFKRNEETAINNYFQSEKIPPRKINQTATSEFDNFASCCNMQEFGPL